jgi:hypothetical protein
MAGMSFDDSAVDEDAYYLSHLGFSFHQLEDLFWRNEAIAQNVERQLQDMRCIWVTRREILRLNIGREEMALEARRIEAVRLWDERLPAPPIRPELVDLAYRERADEERRLNDRFVAAACSIRNYRIRATIISRIIREFYPANEVGRNPYLRCQLPL